jgi:hypothetical protein
MTAKFTNCSVRDCGVGVALVGKPDVEFDNLRVDNCGTGVSHTAHDEKAKKPYREIAAGLALGVASNALAAALGIGV